VFAALIWRPLRRDLGRTLLSLLAIALGVAVVIAIRMANRSAVLSFQQTTQNLAGGADLLITGPAPLPAELLARLIPLSGEAECLPYLDRWAYDPQHQDTLEILGTDLLAASDAATGPARAGPGSGQLPKGLLLPSGYAAEHGLHEGDHLALVIGGRRVELAVAGEAPGSLAVLDLPEALAAFEPQAAPSFDGLRVRLAPGGNEAEVSAALQKLIPAGDQIAPPQARDRQSGRMLAAFRANLAALSYVSLLVGIFLIYNTVSISVVRRRAAIATVRALGAARGAVLRLFLAEGAVLALLGGVAGLGLGWLLADGALILIGRTVESLYGGGRPAPARLLPGDVLWGLALALAAGLLAAWAPARQAAGVAPAQALRPGSAETEVRTHTRRSLAGAAGLALAAAVLAQVPAVRGIPWAGFGCALAAVLAWACLTPPALGALLPRWRERFLRGGRFAAGMAAGGLAGALRRSSILTVALATAVGVMLGVAIMVGSFRQTVQVWLGQQLQADVFVRAADWNRDRPAPLAPALVAAAGSVPGEGALEASHTQAWEYQGEPITLNTHAGQPAGMQLYRFLAGGPGSAIVSEPLARRHHWKPGSTMELVTPHGQARLRISGIFYDYASDRGLLVLDPATFAQYFGAPAPTELGLYAAPGVSTADLRHNLSLALARANLLAGLDINNNAALRGEAMRVFDQTFRITDALEIITLLVAILGVANTLLAVVLEREREFAILRFLGADRPRLRAILLAESGLIATLALGLGWAMGLTLAEILVRVILVQSFGWTIQFHYPYGYLAAASAAVWLATLAAGWLPARAAQRQNPLAAVVAE